MRDYDISVALMALSVLIVMNACTADEKPEPSFNSSLAQNEANCAGSNSLSLTSNVNYEQNIQSIVSAKCLSCHNSQTPVLSSYDGFSAEMNDMVSVVQGLLKPTEHVSVTLTQAEKDLFAAWQTGGFLKNSASTSTSTSVNNSAISASNGCNVLQPGTAHGNELTDLINSEKARNCKAKNLVVNRDKDATGTAECYSATLDMSWCHSKDEIVAKFQELIQAGPATETKVKQILGEGFEIDQCGVEGGKPLATFFKRMTAEERLELRVIRPK